MQQCGFGFWQCVRLEQQRETGDRVIIRMYAGDYVHVDDAAVAQEIHKHGDDVADTLAVEQWTTKSLRRLGFERTRQRQAQFAAAGRRCTAMCAEDR